MVNSGWYRKSRFFCLMRYIRSSDLITLRVRNNVYFIEITPYIGLYDRYDFFICRYIN